MISGVGNIALGDYTLTSVTGYSWFNSMIVNGFDQTIPNSGGAFTNNSVYNAFPERFEQFSQEVRSEEHTSELQSLMRISYAVFCLKQTTHTTHISNTNKTNYPRQLT